MKTKNDNVLTTEEEIQKAIAEELGEEITKAEGGEGIEKGEGGDEEEEEEEDTKTNAKIEGKDKGDEEEEEEEEEETDKSKKAKGGEMKKAVDNEEDAVDALPIIKGFQDTLNIILERQNAMIADMATMRKNQMVVSKAISEKVAGIEDLSKAVEEIHAFGSQRKTFGSGPLDRFEKGEGGDEKVKVLHSNAAEHRNAVIGIMEKSIFDDQGNVKAGAAERGLVKSMRNYVAAGALEKGLWANEFAKEGYILN